MTRKTFAFSLAALTLTASIALLKWLAWPDRAPERPSAEVAVLQLDRPLESPALHTETLTRISFGFTYRRRHPILGGVRPHLAIDYAARTGTPVWAVAEGIVEFARRKGGNGIQVLLRHRSGYKTYYNHLSRIARGVRHGVRVAQKQVIGYVGSTGLFTGPHLDYRVSHNGKFVNPLSERFLPGKPIAEAQRAQFLEHARALVERLEREAPFRL